MKKERLITGVILIFLIGVVFQHEKYTNGNNYSVNTQLDLEDNILGLIDHPPIIIDDNADFETLNFTGEGTELDPYLITNLYINTSGVEARGILVHTTSVHFEIRNCTILTDYVGIDIADTAANTATINNNTIISTSGDGAGITLTVTYGTIITDNECAYFMQGIHLNHAHNNIILNNMILSSNYQGINIRNSNYNELTYNTIENSGSFLKLFFTKKAKIDPSSTLIANNIVNNIKESALYSSKFPKHHHKKNHGTIDVF